MLALRGPGLIISDVDIGDQYNAWSNRAAVFGGFVRMHILHHAAEAPICGVDIIAELARHGYRLSPGTLYPVLHELEKTGCLKARGASWKASVADTTPQRRAAAPLLGKPR